MAMDIRILADDEIEYLIMALTLSKQRGSKVRIANDGGIKIACGAGMWTPPMGWKADLDGHTPIK